jgi:hypothetical protein
MTIVPVMHFVAKCEHCSRSTFPKATIDAAHLAFDHATQGVGFTFPDGRNLCAGCAVAVDFCAADREDGVHVPDPGEPDMCLLCGWPVDWTVAT